MAKIALLILATIIAIGLSVQIRANPPPVKRIDEIVQVDTPFKSRALKGRVVLGSSRENGVGEVLVSLMGAKWKNIISETVSDQDGSFSFPQTREEGHFFLAVIKTRIQDAARKN